MQKVTTNIHKAYYTDADTDAMVKAWDLQEGDVIEIMDQQTWEVVGTATITKIQKLNSTNDKRDNVVHLNLDGQDRTHVMFGVERVITA